MTTEFVLSERAETLLGEAVAAVEATDAEFQHLRDDTGGALEYLGGGGVATIGTLREDRWWGRRIPVALQVQLARYEGDVLVFYHACGRVVDQDMVRAWLDRRGFTEDRRFDMLNIWRLLRPAARRRA